MTIRCYLTKENKIEFIGEWCWSVTAVKDKIYIGASDKVLILNTDGSRVREITPDGHNHSERYFIFIGFVILVYIYLPMI
jgi:ligand-binding sensor domain-containing protein